MIGFCDWSGSCAALSFAAPFWSAVLDRLKAGLDCTTAWLVDIGCGGAAGLAQLMMGGNALMLENGEVKQANVRARVVNADMAELQRQIEDRMDELAGDGEHEDEGVPKPGVS